MAMHAPIARLLDTGDRLHLHHGPIDLIIGAEGSEPDSRHRAFRAAATRFETILEGLVGDLDKHREQLMPETKAPDDVVARRMYRACAPFCEGEVLTPMIAVAGAVADEVLEAMCQAAPLTRAYVNNGGDIALHLAQSASFSIAMSQNSGADLGRIRIWGRDHIGGVATSGTRGRSHSLGIADSVTVLAKTAAQADVMATLIANAVDLPELEGITREPACLLQPDSDLGDRPVVTSVPALSDVDRDAALDAGLALAQRFLDAEHIKGAALFLQGGVKMLGHCAAKPPTELELDHA